MLTNGRSSSFWLEKRQRMVMQLMKTQAIRWVRRDDDEEDENNNLLDRTSLRFEEVIKASIRFI